MIKNDKKKAEKKEAPLQEPLSFEELIKLSEENNEIKIAKPIVIEIKKDTNK